jgi:hypothetical protein
MESVPLPCSPVLLAENNSDDPEQAKKNVPPWHGMNNNSIVV